MFVYKSEISYSSEPHWPNSKDLRVQDVSELCSSRQKLLYEQSQRKLTPGQCSILEKASCSIQFTSWPSHFGQLTGELHGHLWCHRTILRRRAKQLCTVKQTHTHTHTHMHTHRSLSTDPFLLSVLIVSVYSPLFRKLKKERLVHWPPSACVSELVGTWIASSLVWSQYENLQAETPHIVQRIHVDLRSDFSPTWFEVLHGVQHGN